MAIPKRTRKKTIRARRRTGADGAPVEKGFESVRYYFHNEVDSKESIALVKSFITSWFDKPIAKNILANPDYCFAHSYMGSTSFWYLNGCKTSDQTDYWKNALVNRLEKMVDNGKKILKEKSLQKKVENNVVSLSPIQRLQKKISNTIMQDLLDLEDKWIDGEEATIDVYSLFKQHGLPSSATGGVKDVIEGWLLDYEDALFARCDQAVEGYSHLKKPELKRRVKACQEMLLDLDRIKSAAKATRKPRVKKPLAADKQVKRIKYKTEDANFKLVSINPTQLIGKVRLYTFNTKTRTLAEYLTQSGNGFEISGSTIKNFDKVNSRQVRLRKPEAFLPEVLQRTPTQISKAWSDLTTKSSIPNGRINVDTILMRVLDK